MRTYTPQSLGQSNVYHWFQMSVNEDLYYPNAPQSVVWLSRKIKIIVINYQLHGLKCLVIHSSHGDQETRIILFECTMHEIKLITQSQMLNMYPALF